MNTTANPDSTPMADPAESSPAAHEHPHEPRKISGFYLAATFIAFLIFWPLGLALLLWAAWREPVSQWPIVRKFQGRRCGSSTRTGFASAYSTARMRRRPSNSALAAYLESEQERIQSEKAKLDELVRAFEAFKDSEQQNADKKDFEAFLRQREGDQPS